MVHLRIGARECVMKASQGLLPLLSDEVVEAAECDERERMRSARRAGVSCLAGPLRVPAAHDFLQVGAGVSHNHPP